MELFFEKYHKFIDLLRNFDSEHPNLIQCLVTDPKSNKSLLTLPPLITGGKFASFVNHFRQSKPDLTKKLHETCGEDSDYWKNREKGQPMTPGIEDQFREVFTAILVGVYANNLPPEHFKLVEKEMYKLNEMVQDRANKAVLEFVILFVRYLEFFTGEDIIAVV
jgi:hypothetical protein